MRSLRSKLIIVAIVVAASSSAVFAQTEPNPDAIRKLRHLNVAPEKGMLGTPFAEWFVSISGPNATITYESNDCGERNGTADEKGRKFPLCVTARAQDKDGWVLELTFQVGTYLVSPSSKPSLKGPTNFFYGSLSRNEKVASKVTMADVQSKWQTRGK